MLLSLPANKSFNNLCRLYAFISVYDLREVVDDWFAFLSKLASIWSLIFLRISAVQQLLQCYLSCSTILYADWHFQWASWHNATPCKFCSIQSLAYLGRSMLTMMAVILLQCVCHHWNFWKVLILSHQVMLPTIFSMYCLMMFKDKEQHKTSHRCCNHHLFLLSLLLTAFLL